MRAVIEREGLRLALDALVLFAHWVTPPIDTRQFDTRFFMTRVPPDQTPAHDDTETTHSIWMTPAARDRRSRSRRDRPAAADLDDAPRARAVRLGRRRAGVGPHAARRRPRSRSCSSRTARRMLSIPGDPLHPDPAATNSPPKHASCLVDGRWRAECSVHVEHPASGEPSRPTAQLRSARPQLPRSVSVLLVTGFSLRWIATAAAAGPSALVIWVIAALGLFVPLVFTVLELSSRYPEEGGIYVWSKRAFGPFAAFITGWTYWGSNLPYFPGLLYFAAANALFIGGPSWQSLSSQQRVFHRGGDRPA